MGYNSDGTWVWTQADEQPNITIGVFEVGFKVPPASNHADMTISYSSPPFTVKATAYVDHFRHISRAP